MSREKDKISKKYTVSTYYLTSDPQEKDFRYLVFAYLYAMLSGKYENKITIKNNKTGRMM